MSADRGGTGGTSVAPVGGMRRRAFVLASVLPIAFACGETPSDRTITIETLEPVRGPLGGGNNLVIAGNGLENEAIEVTIDGIPATNPTLLQDGRLQVTVPAGSTPGDVDVLVVAGGELAYAPDAYSYNPLPTITSIVPDRGAHTGTAISIVGTGFTDLEAGDAIVRVGADACLDISVQSDTTIVCNAPGGEPWTLSDITVENDNGTVIAEDSFGYMKEGLFAADGRGGIDGNLYFVDLENETYAPIAKLAEGITGLASHRDGTLYGVTSNASASSAGFPRLVVEINPFTGELDTVGQLLTTDARALRVPDIAISYDTELLYGWSKTHRQLVRISLETGRVTLLGGDDNVNGGGLAFDFDSNLYLSPDGSDGALFDVARVDGTLSGEVDLVDAEGDDISAMTSDLNAIYGVREGLSFDGATIATILLQIDEETGVVQELFDLPFGTDALTNTPPLPFK